LSLDVLLLSDLLSSEVLVSEALSLAGFFAAVPVDLVVASSAAVKSEAFAADADSVLSESAVALDFSSDIDVSVEAADDLSDSAVCVAVSAAVVAVDELSP